MKLDDHRDKEVPRLEALDRAERTSKPHRPRVADVEASARSVVLVGRCPGSHVEHIAKHGLTPEEVESAFDNIETRGSHALQSVGRLRSEIEIPRSGDRSYVSSC